MNFFLSGASIATPFSANNLERSAVQRDVWDHGWRSDLSAERKAAAIYPRMTVGTGTGYGNNSQTSSWWQRNGAFLRIKNVEIGYTLPKSWMVRSGFIKSLRVYVAANNLYTFSKFDLWDPEIGGGEGATYPPNRIYSVGLNANF